MAIHRRRCGACYRFWSLPPYDAFLGPPAHFSAGRLIPDNKTIVDFREDNGRAIRQVYARFVALCRTILFAPGQPLMYASSYAALADAATPPSFLISGSGEVPEGKAAGMRASYAVRERRLAGLGMGWRDVTATESGEVPDGKANYCEYITRPGDVSAAGNARQGAPLRRSFLTTFEEVIGKHHLVHRGWEGKSEARHLKRSDRDSPVAYAKNRQLPQGLIEVGVSEERTSLFFRA